MRRGKREPAQRERSERDAPTPATERGREVPARGRASERAGRSERGWARAGWSRDALGPGRLGWARWAGKGLAEAALLLRSPHDAHRRRAQPRRPVPRPAIRASRRPDVVGVVIKFYGNFPGVKGRLSLAVIGRSRRQKCSRACARVCCPCSRGKCLPFFAAILPQLD